MVAALPWCRTAPDFEHQKPAEPVGLVTGDGSDQFAQIGLCVRFQVGRQAVQQSVQAS